MYIQPLLNIDTVQKCVVILHRLLQLCVLLLNIARPVLELRCIIARDIIRPRSGLLQVRRGFSKLLAHEIRGGTLDYV